MLVGESQDLFYALLICYHALIFGKTPVKFNHGINGSLGIGGQCVANYIFYPCSVVTEGVGVSE